jgi:hypothetical protein
LSALAILLSAVLPAQAGDNAPGETVIKGLLSKYRSWTMYSEYTDAAAPSGQAQKLTFEYFERDAKLMGRWILEFGGCEFELSLRNDGFSFPWCPPYKGEPSLSYDAADPQYPFKSRNPRKLWLKANE